MHLEHVALDRRECFQFLVAVAHVSVAFWMSAAFGGAYEYELVKRMLCFVVCRSESGLLFDFETHETFNIHLSARLFCSGVGGVGGGFRSIQSLQALIVAQSLHASPLLLVGVVVCCKAPKKPRIPILKTQT